MLPTCHCLCLRNEKGLQSCTGELVIRHYVLRLLSGLDQFFGVVSVRTALSALRMNSYLASGQRIWMKGRIAGAAFHGRHG